MTVQPNSTMQAKVIRMVSFNCKSIKRSIDSVRQLCKTSDVILLQETWLLQHDLGFVQQIDYDFASYSKSSVDSSAGILRGRPYGGLTIMWRKSLFNNVTVVDCDSDRLAAVKITSADRNLLLINVYMPTDIEENLTEFTDILSRMSAMIEECNIETVYMLGDYNAHHTARFGVEMASFCEEQSWVCVDMDVLGIDSGTFTFLSESHGSTKWLDHCLATIAARKTIVKVFVDNKVSWSDHFPLYVYFDIKLMCKKVYSNESINYSALDKEIKWGNRNLEEISKYTTLCTVNLRKLLDSSPSMTCDNLDNCKDILTRIDNFYNNVVNILQTAAINSKCSEFGARKSNKKKHVTGWNCHIKEYHYNARQNFRYWVECGRPRNGEIYNNMTNTRRIFKQKLKWCQNNEDTIKMDILATHKANKNFSQFWKSTKSFNKIESRPISVENIHNSREIANMFAKHFSVVPLSVEQMPSSLTTLTLNIPQQFISQSLFRTIKNMKRGKSPGHDGLSVEHLLYAGDQLYEALKILFNSCIKYGYLPGNMLKTVVVPVAKNKTGDLSSKLNYRPISLGTIIGKVLERLLQPELMKTVRINDAQFGFRPGLSTDSAILALKHAVNYYKKRETSVYACFLDLSRAFDLVNYDILWRKMHDSNIECSIVRLMRYWYENQTSVVRWGDTSSSEFRLECGVRQGGLTSPDLFNLYINDLIEELSNTGTGCHIDGVCFNNLSYADDMVLLSPSISGLRKLVQICEKYATKHGLQYNVRKSELLVFRVGKGPERVPPVILDGSPVRVVQQFRYLGHMLSGSLSDEMDIERERRSLAIRCNMLARRFARCSGGVKVTLFKAYCMSLYTTQLWVNYSKRSYNALRVQYNNALRILLKMPRHCSASGMFANAGVPDFYAVIRNRIASFWQTVRSSNNRIIIAVAQASPDNIFFNHWLKVHQTQNTV